MAPLIHIVPTVEKTAITFHTPHALLPTTFQRFFDCSRDERQKEEVKANRATALHLFSFVFTISMASSRNFCISHALCSYSEAMSNSVFDGSCGIPASFENIHDACRCSSILFDALIFFYFLLLFLLNNHNDAISAKGECIRITSAKKTKTFASLF